MESGESVFNLIPRPKEEYIKPAMYKSRFYHNATVPPSCSTFGLQGTTKITANDAGTAMTHPNAPAPKSSHERTVHKAPLVTRAEKPVMGLVTDKDFVKDNALEVVHSAPPQLPTTQTLHTQHDTFAKVPPYLRRIKEQINAETSAVASIRDGQAAAQVNRLQPLTDDERAQLLNGLKKKWEECHKQYQKLTFNIDTNAKVQKKEGLEVEMERIEKAMQKLSKKNVFVYDDSSFH